MDPSNKFHEYQVIGRHAPTEKDPNPKIYRMRIFAKSPIFAKSRFWYFLSRQRKVKRASGEVLSVNEIKERKPLSVKNFGIVLRYNSRTGTHNLYKEYRDLTRVGAVQQLYSDMAGQYRARFRDIQIISVDAVPASKTRRLYTKQFHNSKIRFPLPHRVVKALDKRFKPTFSQKRPVTHF